MKLHKSKVIFDPKAHTYHLDGVRLSGITGILSKHLFPQKYDDIPKYILEKAAERGSFIHESCEIADSLGVIPDCEEAQNYLKLKEENGLVTLRNEYLVSDETNFASQIDIVFDDKKPSNDSVSLADIKTTYKLDTEYISWQLSIYAYLFELNNKGLKVSKLYAIWLRGEKAELVQVDRKPNDLVKSLLECEVNGALFSTDIQTTDSVPSKIVEVEQYMIDLDAQLKKLKDEKDALMKGIYEEMEKAGVDNWKTERMQLIRKKPYEKQSFDSTSFRKEHPDMYNQFVKSTIVKGSVTFKAV